MSQVPFRIHLFGPPEFRVNGKPLPRLKTRKGVYILALLAIRSDRDIERSWLAGTLWPENPERTARTYLRQSLTDLRHALGDDAARLLSPSPRTLRLDLEEAEVDLLTFRQCLKRGDSASLEQAVSLYRGPLLEGWAEDWLLSEREANAQAYLSTLEMLARRAQRDDPASAVRYLREIVAADPLRESASRSLMQILAAGRDYAAVTQVYRNLRTVLRSELHAEPDAETQALFARLRAEARTQAARPARTSSENPPERQTAPAQSGRGAARIVPLPQPLSEFIGRNREIEGVKRTIMTARLVTLTGIGGVGKTRLALRVAEEIADDYPDGVHFVDLSPLTDPALVARAAASVLGVGETPGLPLTQSLCEFLRARHLLLLLDNCEHLNDVCGPFAATLLQECPNLRILATSRQRLGISGETVRRVPPLGLPDGKLQFEDDKNAVSALMEYEAVRLFVDRAQRVQPNLYLNPPMLRSVAVLCRRLDGIPLALELAAARTTVLDPAQITARLKERFRLLSGGDRSAPTRQRTLRAALDWSFGLLQPEEQILLRRLSVFVGGWTLEAAEVVCVGPGEEANLEEWEILDCLTGLADHSLVVVESENGQARYRLLETVREYGRERLRDHSVAESQQVRTRHREYYAHFVRDAVSHLGRSEQVQWLDRLERDHDNLRAAMDGCLDEGTPEAMRVGLQLAGELQRFWSQRGHVSEGRRWYAALLSRLSPDAEPSPERGRSLEGAGILAYRQGDYTASGELLERALENYRHLGMRGAMATSLNVLGDIACTRGDNPGSLRLLEMALTLRRETGNRPGEAATLNSMGNVTVHLGDLAKARTLYEQALTISQEVGDRALEASILNGLGVLADYRNDTLEARTLYEQALLRNREIGDASHMIVNIYNLANNAFKQGDAVQAEERFREGLLRARDLGESRNRRLIAFLLKGLAVTAEARDLPEKSARLLGASDAQREVIGIPLNPDDMADYDRLVNALGTTLGEEQFAALWNAGRMLRMDQAVAIALEQ